MEFVNDYGDWSAEYAALRQTAGVLDLSFRGRICLTGADRTRFLHGQVTNDVRKLPVGGGCYAALVTAKGKMESDLNILCLADELLLDFESGLTERVSQRLEKFIVADDVQVVDVAPHYGLLSVQGPKAEETVRATGWFGVPPSGGPVGTQPGRANAELPAQPFDSIKISDPALGEIYLMNHPRLLSVCSSGRESAQSSSHKGQSRLTSAATDQLVFGFDLFVPNSSLNAVKDQLIEATKKIGGRLCGCRAFEAMRVEAGIPRFGLDMDETNIPLECGIESRAISYNKGCYIGQEVINRIHSIGHVNKELRGLRLADDLQSLPEKGDKLFRDGKDAGYITSAVRSPVAGNIALGYVRREAIKMGAGLTLRTVAGESPATVVELPFGR